MKIVFYAFFFVALLMFWSPLVLPLFSLDFWLHVLSFQWHIRFGHFHILFSSTLNVLAPFLGCILRKEFNCFLVPCIKKIVTHGITTL